MKCPEGTENCIKESKNHDTCHIMSDLVSTEGFKPLPFGSAVEYRSGAVKADGDKYDPTMLSKEMVELVSKVRMFGAKKYSRNNWKKGFKVTRSLAAALRHIFAFLSGEDLDPESGLSHLGHAICSIEHAVYDMEHHKENDDRKE